MNMFWYYLFGINVVAFFLFAIDKRKAIKDEWRISEATLLGAALVGGSLGAWIGMHTFRHKTKHWRFRILVPLFFLIQAAGILWLSMN